MANQGRFILKSSIEVRSVATDSTLALGKALTNCWKPSYYGYLV